MSKLVVAVFEDEATARRALVQAAEARAQGRAEIEDACLVARHADGSVHVRETSDIATWKASAYGSAWGLIAGALVGLPLAGAAAAAGLAGAVVHRRDVGIRKDFERAVGEQLEPGRSAVVVLVEDEAADEVAEVAVRLGAWTSSADVAAARSDRRN